MGRMLGAFDESNDYDRPDLNKCPDCGCFFEETRTPLRHGNFACTAKENQYDTEPKSLTFH